MADIVVGEPYREPTQWCVDITVDGVPYQLTFQEYPPSSDPPPSNVISETVTRVTTPPETTIILEAEDGATF